MKQTNSNLTTTIKPLTKHNLALYHTFINTIT